MYDVTSGRYLGRFNIPKYRNKGLTWFIVDGKHLIATFDNYLVKYRL